MADALTRADLDGMGCQHPSHDGTEPCAEVYLHARCHPSAGTRASYSKATGVLTVRCRHCRAHVASLAIAEGERG